MSSLQLSRINPLPALADELYFLTFNQDHTCMASGTHNGFRIFNSDPYKETFKRDFSGGIGMVEMLFRCNILALVGGGQDPAFLKNKVILWDDNQSAPIGELTFKSDVRAVKMRRDKIVVVLEKFVYVYNFDKLERIRKYETTPNAKGIVALSPIDQCVLAFPHTTKGVVRVELLDANKSHLINAHEGNINCIALNMDGTRLATASEKGTLIRVFDTGTGQKLQEVRRGADKAEIFSITFSHDSNFFCTSSDKGTIHVFALKKTAGNGNGQALDDHQDGNGKKSSGSNGPTQNRRSKLSLLGGYFNSEWSFAWAKGPECPSICCFSSDNKSLLVFTAEGTYLKLNFDPQKGGECTMKSFSRFYRKKK